MSDSFSDYLTDTLNKGSLSLMLSIGHRTRLFDIMSKLSPSTVEQIAKEANLNQRYVKEWLGAMVTGKIIDYDSSNSTFSLQKEKAQFLTRKDNQYNFSASMQWIPVLAQVEDKIVECFHHGGGVPYSSYNRFHEVMAEESYQTVVVGLTDHILPLVPGLIGRLEDGIGVLDIGCGRGKAVNILAKKFPNSTFVGYDVAEEAIKGASADSKALNNFNTLFEVQNLLTVQPSKKFDLITAFDVIHDQIDPSRTLKFIFDSLKSGGVFLMQDILSSTELAENINHPLGPFLYTISCLHCMSVSLSQNGAGLGAMWGKEKASDMLKDAGFVGVEVKTLSHDFQNYYYTATRP
jgi:2-polyprenyl-3-methyl-5-hydroxy-6-metoxy-1,4-benzoquinol methylase